MGSMGSCLSGILISLPLPTMERKYDAKCVLHTGLNYSRTMSHFLMQYTGIVYDIDPCSVKIEYMVSDHCATVKKALQSLSTATTHMNCFAHVVRKAQEKKTLLKDRNLIDNTLGTNNLGPVLLNFHY